MAQANPTPNTVEDILDVAENLDALREFVEPSDSVALDYLVGKLLGAADRIEAREAA